MRVFTSGLGRGTLAILLTTVVGCGSREDGDGIEREALSGTVTLGGAPLNNASIQFIPAGPGAGAGTSGAIAGGEFKIPKERGAAVGGYRVLISSNLTDDGAEGEAPGVPSKPKLDPIPKKYNVDSTLNAEVKAGGPNEFKFDLDAK